MQSTANTWVKFFVAAGIPNTNAACYAHVFHENRIQMDMLSDLNKEYLREMGITPMGDVIAILRHAKNVSEQSARDKILNENDTRIPVAAVPATITSSNKISLKSQVTSNNTSKTETAVVLPKPARRVLPEHEGQYKIVLPSGTTQRSKEILAKRALLYADKPDKNSVFERLQKHDSEVSEPSIKIVGLDKPTSSVFSRLGGLRDSPPVELAGILKKPEKRQSFGGVSKKLVKPQKVILVHKRPAKAATMVADEYERLPEKSVSFSSEDEILEIEARPLPKPGKKMSNASSIKTRLGMGVTKSQLSTSLNRSRRVSQTNAEIRKITKTQPNNQNWSKMKSDLIDSRNVSIKSRLTLKKHSSPIRGAKKKETISSVFDRLGFNN
ncbi:hypothetical protein Bhyg_04471 [Pseudolycoriella hygida]|uniref:SAM domain-containing protein n=1 Tax=Pseudolycoriella hygida TaxID=35572 RepID=A0A9Q0S8H1_9DIPT|nr:hypothetical protein Bhyg_04471 [Pseudolycoriella hygida]